MTTAYRVREADGATLRIQADTIAEAREVAEGWLREAADEEERTTQWIDGYRGALSGDDPEPGDEEAITVQVDPEEPDCTGRAGHMWGEVAGSLQGHGGGVWYSEACAVCMLRRDTDTWAQRDDTGEQGLRSVTYRRTEEAGAD